MWDPVADKQFVFIKTDLYMVVHESLNWASYRNEVTIWKWTCWWSLKIERRYTFQIWHKISICTTGKSLETFHGWFQVEISNTMVKSCTTNCIYILSFIVSGSLWSQVPGHDKRMNSFPVQEKSFITCDLHSSSAIKWKPSIFNLTLFIKQF